MNPELQKYSKEEKFSLIDNSFFYVFQNKKENSKTITQLFS